MLYRIIIVAGLMGMFFVPSRAQEYVKQEQEKRIKLQEIPKVAQDYLDSIWLKESRRKRFYRETDGKNLSYETKLVRNRRRFNIEFNDDGKLQDIEELTRFEEIPDSVRLRTDSVLTNGYSRHTIQRIQRQFLPNQTDDYQELTSENTQNYELEVSLNEGSEVHSYEMLFNSQSVLQQKRLIIRRLLDNFLY
ncbi:hypothetical protein [Tunicatimonas pelagia]|uniref:hypothetical protein n=1 Tax=Tunicatimonas pelagia TaxID=931531 RepID=UPI002665F119|nr:hypothetical protein [Tunicatimonas pelagia]WKN46097.1 hypothetical protein P0M28_14175 [Tunicatimonas pelagia]